MIHTFLRTLIIIGIFFNFGIPATQAYFTTNQEAILLPQSHTGLFLIEYSFGMNSKEVFLPITAKYSDEKRTDMVSYAMVDEDGVKVAGKTTGMVLSNAAIRPEGMYATPKSTAKKFTLAVFFTPETYDANKKYRLQVTYLPFNFDGTQQLQLNPSELIYYTTKPISL